MTEPTTIAWLGRKLVLAIHDLQLAEHGGGDGLRDSGLLDSALARPMNRAAYGEPDMPELGALYALGIARNHPFVDGNKRTAWAAMVTFLDLNAVEFLPGEVEAATTMLAMAAGEMPDDDFIAWVRCHAKPRR
jgi:death-on-curing protein